MTRVDLDAVAQLDEPAQAVEEPLGALPRRDGEVGAGSVADEERVAGEHQPRLVSSRAVDHRERAVLGPVPRRVKRPDHDVAELDLRPVLEVLVLERRLRLAVEAHRQPVLERQPSVAGDVVGVRVRLEHADEPDAAPLRLDEERFDRVGRVDGDGHARLLVADEVRGAAEVVVHELREEHRAKLPPDPAMNQEVKRALPLACALALALPAAASAHANLVRIAPAPGAVVARAPAAVRVTFDEDVRAGPGIAAVRNGGGSILRGRASVVDGRTLVVPLREGIGDGDYSVRWTIVSDDGHLESGVVAFAVGAGRAPPQSVLAPAATGPDAGSVLARWLFLAGVLLAAGLAILALAVPGARAGEGEERLALLLTVAAALAAVGAGSEAHRVGLDTRDGTALLAGFVTAVGVGLLAGAATLERRALRPALLLALGLVAVPSVAGHALDPGLARVNVAADVLHVAAAAAWVGVLVGLAALPGARLELRRVSRLALAAVGVLALTGILRASFELLSASQLVHTGYGRALLVKTGLLLAALGLGLGLRRRLPQRLAVELLLVAGLLAAVAVLVQLRPGRNAVAVPVAAPPAPRTLEPSPQPPPPPPGALVLAREAGPLAVALEAEPRRVTAIVLSPAGGGLGGLAVRFLPSGVAATACGSGCYAAALAPGRRVVVEVSGYGPTRRTAFSLPASALRAGAIVRRARAVFRAQAGISYDEHLASDPTHAVDAHWRLEKPTRVAYTIAGGAQAVVVGGRRWDRDSPDGAWHASAQLPRLPQPATQWETSTNARVLSLSPRAVVVSFADPTIPAFFTLVLDPRTLLPRLLRMTAAAHFMLDRYTSFSSAREIRPPR